MEKKITAQTVEKLMAIKGEARGVTFLYDWEFILETRGQNSLKKIEARMAELGYPIKYSEIKRKKMAFYPIGLDALSTLVIKELFNLDERQLKEMGASKAKFPLFLKIFIKYFVSFDSLVKGVPKMWREHYTVGDLEVVEADNEKELAVLRLKNFSTHKALCIFLTGYFPQVLSVVLGAPVDCRETKCVFDGDDYHEFLLTWGDKQKRELREARTKNITAKMANVKGEARGVVFKTDAVFVLKEKGREGLEKVQSELKSKGHFIDYEQIKTMGFYPLGLRVLSLLAMQKALGFSEKDIEHMGAEAPKASLIVKLFGKFLFSIDKMSSQAPQLWARHYTVGQLEVDPHEKEKYVVVRLRGLDIHPLFCVYLKGYFSTIIRMIINSPIISEETKCSFTGGKKEYHEFLFKW